ncbi:MAG: redoxin domain-containing protein [Planctomycetota bacterium]|nr:redoxin domain-containing protein [Planctomycetota bacterium]
MKHNVDTAAACGPAMPYIAHNWHMGGHVFAHLGRHFDASWQQEASARVDHAHMARFWILPDEIHNFAHNNEWLTRSLRHQGRVDEAVELAKNMVELPRHPRFNTVDKPRTSSAYGRRRLIETLSAFEQWETLKELGSTMYLEPHVEDAGGAARADAMGRAAAHRGDPDGLAAATVELESMIVDLKRERAEAVDEAEAEALAADEKTEDVREAMDEALRAFEGRLRTLRDNVDALRALAELAAGGDRGAALAALEEARYDRIHLARMLVESEDAELREKAIETAREAAKNRKAQLVEHATLAHVLWEAGEREEAMEVFEGLREGAALADLELPPLRRLAPIAAELGLGADWRPDFAPASDVAARPDLDGLGPAHWIPPMAPDFTLPDAYGDEVTLSDFRGRPVLVVNFLGFGCVHCVEQLQALVPVADRFHEAGIEILAVGLNSVEDVRESLGDDPDDTGFPFRVLADPSLAQFKEWRAFDDFEGIALHGTYLVDGNGRLRWIDISHLPFMDVEFLLDEAKRLLALPVRGDGPLAAATVASRPDAVSVPEPGPADVVVPPNGLRVGLVLDTAPHCENCIKDLNRILGGLEGFVSLEAKPDDARIAVIVDSTCSGSKAVLAALVAGGRPGRVKPE